MWKHCNSPQLAWVTNMYHASLRDYCKLSAQVLCSWGLVFAYHQTFQGHYECQPPPHAIATYNHKVNYYSHLHLNSTEWAIVQYVWVLQYVSYKSRNKYYHMIAPAVKCFQARVVWKHHIAFLCAPFFKDVKTQVDYNKKQDQDELAHKRAGMGDVESHSSRTQD